MKLEVGKRYLVRNWHVWRGDLLEAKVLEISPSKERVKFEFLSGEGSWVDIDDWRIVEELATLIVLPV